MSNQYFQFRKFTIFQDRCAMKVGTDGTLLGAWARGGKRILDIGTGTGLVALMMAQRFPEASVLGVDIDADACMQASQNAEASPYANRVSIECCDVRYLCLHERIFFDSIVSNPPYFQDSLKNPDLRRSKARHTDTLSYDDLFRVVSGFLSEDGEFSLIIPFDCRENLIISAMHYGFFKSRICAVQTTRKKQPRRYLMAFRKHIVESVEESVGVIEDAPNIRSEWYRNLTSDFYL